MKYCYLTCEQIVDEGDRQTEDTHKHVSDGQIDNEVISNVMHPLVPVNHGYHERITNHPKKEHDGVGHGINHHHVYRLF